MDEMNGHAAGADDIDLTTVRRVVGLGDLAKLTQEERFQYYLDMCRAVGLNPVTQPFKYVLMKQGGLKLYATKDCGDQLRMKHGISVTFGTPEKTGDVMYVLAKAVMPNGRVDEDIGAVSIGNARGDQMANAIMRMFTKARRRATLSICGLGGVCDETDLDTMGELAAVSFEDAQGKPPAPRDRPSTPVLPEPERPAVPAESERRPPKSAPGPVELEPEGPPDYEEPPIPFDDDKGRAAPSNSSLVNVFVQAMRSAESIRDLNIARDKVMELKFSSEELSGVQAAYKARKRELSK